MVGFKPEKLYRVGEILEFLKKHQINISRQTLHNYTLYGLIKEAKRTSAGHRLYSEDIFERLLKIETLKRHHKISELKRLLSKIKRG